MVRTKRRANRWRSAGAAAAILLLVGAGIASAAQLGVTAQNRHVETLARCSTTLFSVHVNPTGFSIGLNKTAVRITNYPAACNGRTVLVGVSNGAGTLLASGTATCSASPCVITTGSYNATQVTRAHVVTSTVTPLSTQGKSASWDSVCTVFLGIFMTCT